MRPATMKILDDFTEHNILALEHAKREGRKIIGFYFGTIPASMPGPAAPDRCL